MAKKPAAVGNPKWPASNIEWRQTHSLLAYQRNSRIHSDEQVDQIAASMTEFGWTIPMLVDESGIIIAGHGRALAAAKIGISEVPVMVAKGWTEAQKMAYRIADNRLPESASWDPDMLRLELTELGKMDFDLALTGFDDLELVQFMATPNVADPEETPEPPVNPVSRKGDLWLLGKHRLLCGDSTNGEDVNHLMAGTRAKLFSTDPPYAVDYDGGSHPQSKTNSPEVANKDWSADYHEASPLEDGKKFYAAFVDIAVKHAISDRAAWYCWHASRRQAMLEAVWETAGAFVHQQIIWVKSRPVLTHSAYMWQHEPCLMGWIKGKKPATRTGDMEFKTTVWEVPNKEIESSDHPTSKPTSLFRVPMLAHTSAGDVVYEPFSGSGTQIIAAEMINRWCYATEISPQFVDVAVQRWQTYTSQEAILESTGETYAEVAQKRLHGAQKPAGVPKQPKTPKRAPKPPVAAE